MPAKSKHIRLYKNGDTLYAGYSMVINPSVMRTWDVFMDTATQRTQYIGGAYRLYSAEDGQLLNSLDDLVDGGLYVLAGRERFKKVDYSGIQDFRLRQRQYDARNKGNTNANTTINTSQRLMRSGRAQKDAVKARGFSINVAANEDLTTPPVKVLINSRITPTLGHVLEEATKRLKPADALRQLYTADGALVTTVSELQDKGNYIAVGRRKLNLLPYFDPIPKTPGGTVARAFTLPGKSPTLKSPMLKSPTQLSPSRAKTNSYAAMLSPTSAVAPAPRSPTKPLQSYNLTVVTGKQGTDANVFITLYGAKGDSGRRRLREDPDNFQSGGEDVFALECAALGPLQRIVIEQDNTGASSSWYLEEVVIRDNTTKAKLYFHYHDWLAMDRGPMKTKAEIFASKDPKAPVMSRPADLTIKDDIFSAKRGSQGNNQAASVEDDAETQEDRPEAEGKAHTVDDENGLLSPSKTPSKSPKSPSKPVKLPANPAVDKAEAEFKSALADAKKLKDLWARLDYNGNGKVSLAELDKFIATSYPALNHKPALMRCYKKVTLRDGDGDAWIEKFEFPALLSNLPYFVRLWLVFAEADKTGNDAANDRRLTVEEASPLLQQLGLAKSASQAKTVFKEIDSNGGGCLLFDELVIYAAKKRLNIAGTVMEQYTRTDERHASANGRKSSAGPTSPAGSNKKKSSDGAMLKPNPTLDKTEAELKSIIGDAGKLKSFWKKLDYNANGKVSLAELDKFVSESYPVLNHKPALMRCYKKVTLRDGDGDAWIERQELPALLSNLPYFVRLWLIFASGDTSGNPDRRLTVEEATPLLLQLHLASSVAEAEQVFAEMDENHGGWVLFDEFAAFAAKKHLPIHGTVMTEYTTADSRPETGDSGIRRLPSKMHSDL